MLDDNHGMRAIAETIDSRINREYVIYEKALRADATDVRQLTGS